MTTDMTQKNPTLERRRAGGEHCESQADWMSSFSNDAEDEQNKVRGQGQGKSGLIPAGCTWNVQFNFCSWSLYT